MNSAPISFDLVAAAPRLREWATRAAISYGTYSGINAAIKDAKDKSLPAVHTADAIRDEMTVLTVIRVFALLDRSAEVSLQVVNRFLKQDDAFDRVLDAYTAGDPPHFRPAAESTCRAAVESFKSSYQQIDWEIHGRLQAFRNGAIAHISLSEVKALLTYSQLEHFVRLCARMSADVSMMASGLNVDPEERLRDAHCPGSAPMAQN